MLVRDLRTFSPSMYPPGGGPAATIVSNYKVTPWLSALSRWAAEKDAADETD